MRITAPVAAAFALLLASTSVPAKPTTFECHNVRYAWSVTLDVSGKTAKGTFIVDDTTADDAERRTKVAFTGKVIPTPKGKKGVYLEMNFAVDPPYNVPPEAKAKRRIVWYLKIVEGRAHLFIPMQVRNEETRPYSWVVHDIEFEPADD